MNKPTIEIEYCTQCGFMLRATWVAEELLMAFAQELGAVSLVPGSGGHFIVRLGDELLFSRKEIGRFPEPKELKQLVAERIAPERTFGHRRDP
jgi:selenoprotein W-related protein